MTIEQFLEPEKEVLVARNGAEVAQHLRELSPERAKKIGEAALKRVLAEHTYAHRAEQLEKVLSSSTRQKCASQPQEVMA